MTLKSGELRCDGTNYQLIKEELLEEAYNFLTKILGNLEKDERKGAEAVYHLLCCVACNFYTQVRLNHCSFYDNSQ